MVKIPQGSRVPFLLHAAIFLAVVAAAHAQQGFFGFQGFLDYVIGECSNYQTSRDFTQSYIDQMRASEQGYILALSTGNSDSCQKLSFTSDSEFNYSFIDIANFPRNYTSSYEMSLANLTNPAQISLNMLPGLLGADTAGILSLKPLIVDDEKLVVAACWQRGYFKREQLQVFVPFPSTTSVDAIKTDLVKKISGAEDLKEISQECVAGVRMAPQPIPLRVYNLVLAFDNSGRELATFRNGTVTDPALDFYRNFQEPRITHFALPFSTFYQPTGAVYQPAEAVYQPAGAEHQPAGAMYQPAGTLFYSAPQRSVEFSAGPPRVIETKPNKNIYTKFYR